MIELILATICICLIFLMCWKSAMTCLAMWGLNILPGWRREQYVSS